MKHEIPSKLRLNSNHFGKLLLQLHALNHVVIDTIITHTLHSNHRHHSMRLLLCRVKYSTDGSQEGTEGATMKPFTPSLFLVGRNSLAFSRAQQTIDLSSGSETIARTIAASRHSQVCVRARWRAAGRTR